MSASLLFALASTSILSSDAPNLVHRIIHSGNSKDSLHYARLNRLASLRLLPIWDIADSNTIGTFLQNTDDTGEIIITFDFCLLKSACKDPVGWIELPAF